jgi:hypothetical protein
LALVGLPLAGTPQGLSDFHPSEARAFHSGAAPIARRAQAFFDRRSYPISGIRSTGRAAHRSLSLWSRPALAMRTTPTVSELLSTDQVLERLRLFRGHAVLLDVDLARFYGVSRSRLRALADAFPGEYCFTLELGEAAIGIDDLEEFEALLPVAFTEYGAVAAAFALRTPRAMSAATCVIRAFAAGRHHRSGTACRS